MVTGVGVAPLPELRLRLHGNHRTAVALRLLRGEHLRLGVADPYLSRGGYRLYAGACTELAWHGGDAALGGLLGDAERAGDVGVGAALAEQGQHLELATGQRPGWRGWTRGVG